MTFQHKTAAIVYQFLIGLRTCDWDLLQSILDDDIAWNLPGTSLISGEARGVDAVNERAKLFVSYGLTFTQPALRVTSQHSTI